MDSVKYSTYQKKKFQHFELICKRCGACCGSFDGDPCANLCKDEKGVYLCSIYDRRIGLRKTVSGKDFYCVPMADLKKHGALRQGCAYDSKNIF